MQSFIEEVIDDVWGIYDGVDQLIFILPSKRAGTFLKNALSKRASATLISPDVYSIEEFIEHISGISSANNTQQLFELYEAYLEVGSFEKETFDSFLKWGQTLLQDFNEIDRYLINPSSIFSNLSAIQEVNHWSLKSEKTNLMENYLHFWKHLEPIYEVFNTKLLANQTGHQGLAYRKASENLALYLKNENKNHVFLGFNALNNSENNIIQTILYTSNSQIYWDIDSYFLQDPIHDAGLFIRKHMSSWNALKGKTLKGLSTHYLSEKKIEVIGVPKNIAQSKYVGDLLLKLYKKSPESIKQTALILGDESLLNPLLNTAPSDIPAINITMGQKLELTTLASFFKSFIELHEQKTKKGWFHRDLICFLSHSFTTLLLTNSEINVEKLISKINLRNWTYITPAQLNEVYANDTEVLSLIFSSESGLPKSIVQTCRSIILLLKEILLVKNDQMALEQLYRFHNLFNQIDMLLSKYDYVTTLRGFKNLFQQLLASETLDFQGDPLEGLQIMGMLESRNLDFETVILTSVNEGILPSGKSNNSFIPFDLKIEYGLPTYKEKDAVYTYHFYRLLQRAKNVYLIYNTEPDVLEGGEKSRLITQLLTDVNRIDITEKIASPFILPIVTTKERIEKTESLTKMIESYSKKGFSPSSLSNYIRNPIDFYKQNLLGIEDIEAVEENIAANTFGTIVHDTLEELYSPFVDSLLSKEMLIEAKSKIAATVKSNFQKTYLDGDIKTGRNFLSYHVIIKYIQKFIDSEIKNLEGHSIKIIALEKKLAIDLVIPEINHPILLKGKLDRIDEIDGITRIIDYKTGKVEKRNVEIISWEPIIEDYQYSKAFQLLCYALMYKRLYPAQDIQAGIISLKNLKEGIMLFAKKESMRGAKESSINSEMLIDFEQLLYQLIREIYNSKVPFLEKEI